MSHRRMLAGHLREQPGEKWAHYPGHKPDGTCFLADVHEPQKKGHDTDQFERQLNAIPSGFENAIYHHLEDQRVIQEGPFYKSNGKADQEKAKPDITKRHNNRIGPKLHNPVFTRQLIHNSLSLHPQKNSKHYGITGWYCWFAECR